MIEHTAHTTCVEVLLDLSAAHHGWFRSRDAEARGVSPATLSRLRSLGSVETPKRGTNRLVRYPDSWEGRATGATWTAGPHAALGRWAAVRLIRGTRSSPAIDVVVPRAVEVRGATVPVRTSVRLTADDVHRVQGLPATSAAFTVCDLAAITGTVKLTQLADQLVAEDRLSLDDLHEMVARFRGIKGVARLRRVLEELSPASRWSRSEGERAWLRIVGTTGLPAPVMNLRTRDAAGRRRYLDAAWPELRISVEIDLHPKHGTTLGRREDGHRQNDLVLAGWTVLRFDLADLLLRPDLVAATVVRAVERALAGAR